MVTGPALFWFLKTHQRRKIAKQRHQVLFVRLDLCCFQTQGELALAQKAYSTNAYRLYEIFCIAMVKQRICARLFCSHKLHNAQIARLISKWRGLIPQEHSLWIHSKDSKIHLILFRNNITYLNNNTNGTAACIFKFSTGCHQDQVDTYQTLLDF